MRRHLNSAHSCWLNGASRLESTNCLPHCDNNTRPLKGLAPAATAITEVVSQQECYFDVWVFGCVRERDYAGTNQDLTFTSCLSGNNVFPNVSFMESSPVFVLLAPSTCLKYVRHLRGFCFSPACPNVFAAVSSSADMGRGKSCELMLISLTEVCGVC